MGLERIEVSEGFLNEGIEYGRGHKRLYYGRYMAGQFNQVYQWQAEKRIEDGRLQKRSKRL